MKVDGSTMEPAFYDHFLKLHRFRPQKNGMTNWKDLVKNVGKKIVRIDSMYGPVSLCKCILPHCLVSVQKISIVFQQV